MTDWIQGMVWFELVYMALLQSFLKSAVYQTKKQCGKNWMLWTFSYFFTRILNFILLLWSDEYSHDRFKMTEWIGPKNFFRSYSPVQVRRLNEFISFLLFRSFSPVFWSCSTVKVHWCNLSVKFQLSHSSV